MKEGRIVKVSGPLVVAEGMTGCKMYDVVNVSEKKIIGEIIELKGDFASIQVYEETGGIGPGEPVYTTFEPLSVELGPGLIESIYDGIQRPLDLIEKMVGDYIQRGVSLPGLDRERRWEFSAKKKKGDKVVTSSGLFGVIFAIDDDRGRIILKTSDDTKLEFLKSSIAARVEK